MPITQEQAEEYRQVASLLVSDIDTLSIILEDESMTAEQIREQVDLLVESTKELTTNKEKRESRWQAYCNLMGAIRGITPNDG
jgi:uncharacterized coiled-coil protein SlyX